MTDIKLSQLIDQSPATVAAGAGLWSAGDHMDGLAIAVMGDRSIRVGSGTAAIPIPGYIVTVTDPITKSALILEASTRYYLYLFAGDGGPDIEIDITPPDSPYLGYARTKRGDQSRRYIGTLLTSPTGTIASATRIGVNAGQIYGLRMSWVNGGSISVSAGGAYVPGVGNIVLLYDSVTISPATSASSWLHLYLADGTSGPTIEASTIAPAAPYAGTARTKSGDPSRRYVGSLLTDAGGSIIRFQHNGDRVDYLLQAAGFSTGPQRVVSGKKDATEQTVDLSGIVPVSAAEAICIVQMTKNDIGGYGTILGSVSGTMSVTTVSPQGCIQASILIVVPQTLYINVTSTWSGPQSEGAFLDVTGYRFGR